MKSLAYSLALFLVVGLAAGQSDPKTKAESQMADHWFDYDTKPSTASIGPIRNPSCLFCVR